MTAPGAHLPGFRKKNSSSSSSSSSSRSNTSDRGNSRNHSCSDDDSYNGSSNRNTGLTSSHALGPGKGINHIGFGVEVIPDLEYVK